MAKLKKAGLVDSTRGAGGGYRWGRSAAEFSVGDVLRVLEGSLEAAQCSGMEDESTCENHDICVTKYVWKRINDSITPVSYTHLDVYKRQFQQRRLNSRIRQRRMQKKSRNN